MIKVAKKYKVSFAPLTLETSLKKQMLIGHYKRIRKDIKTQLNSEKMKCLHGMHYIRTVGNMKDFEELLAVTTGSYKAYKNHVCRKYKNVRRKGCYNLHKYSSLTRKHINKLHRKWHPDSPNKTCTMNDKEIKWLEDKNRYLFKLDITIRSVARVLGSPFK